MPKEDNLKSIKINPSTHARLVMMSSILDKTISDVIDDVMELAYPDIVAEADKMVDHMNSLRQLAASQRQKKQGKENG